MRCLNCGSENIEHVGKDNCSLMISSNDYINNKLNLGTLRLSVNICIECGLAIMFDAEKVKKDSRG